MAKRVLIVGRGSHAVAAIGKARELGFHTVTIDPNPEAPCLAAADEAVRADSLDAASILEAAQKYEVNGVYPASEQVVIAASSAAMVLELPATDPKAAAILSNKAAMRAAFQARGVPNPPFRAARTLCKAETAGREIGMPAIVKPADGTGSAGVMQVDHIEDLPLAFTQAVKASSSKTALIERAMEGPEFWVDGFVRDGAFTVCGILGIERSVAPRCFPIGVFGPVSFASEKEQELTQAATAALDAVGFTHGCAHVEMIDTREGPRIIELAGYPTAAYLPKDLIREAGGCDGTANALRLALGEVPEVSAARACSAALYWIRAGSGVVTEVAGLDAVRALPGVQDVAMHVKPGDTVRHIMDCADRDRIGYVVATADNLEAAVAAAKRARDLCEVMVRPAC
jgi:biotin carboxylase